MTSFKIAELYGMKAAFIRAAVSADAHDVAFPVAPAPVSQLAAAPAHAAAARKRAVGNEPTFMIQTRAARGGASGPSPWGCPV